MLYIVLAISLASTEVQYCTKPDTLEATQAALTSILASDWSKVHPVFKQPIIVDSTNLRYTRAINGFTYDDEAGNRIGVVVPPCRLFGTD